MDRSLASYCGDEVCLLGARLCRGSQKYKSEEQYNPFQSRIGMISGSLINILELHYWGFHKNCWNASWVAKTGCQIRYRIYPKSPTAIWAPALYHCAACFMLPNTLSEILGFPETTPPSHVVNLQRSLSNLSKDKYKIPSPCRKKRVYFLYQLIGTWRQLCCGHS